MVSLRQYLLLWRTDQHRWNGAFNAVSAFNNSGMSLLDANMVAWPSALFGSIVLMFNSGSIPNIYIPGDHHGTLDIGWEYSVSIFVDMQQSEMFM